MNDLRNRMIVKNERLIKMQSGIIKTIKTLSAADLAVTDRILSSSSEDEEDDSSDSSDNDNNDNYFYNSRSSSSDEIATDKDEQQGAPAIEIEESLASNSEQTPQRTAVGMTLNHQGQGHHHVSNPIEIEKSLVQGNFTDKERFKKQATNSVTLPTSSSISQHLHDDNSVLYLSTQNSSSPRPRRRDIIGDNLELEPYFRAINLNRGYQQPMLCNLLAAYGLTSTPSEQTPELIGVGNGMDLDQQPNVP